MQEVKFKIDEKGEGAFFLEEEGRRLGEMVISVSDKMLTVHHTEVSPELQGKGASKKLFEAMIDYLYKNQLKVFPLCSYVQSVFKKDPEKYKDIWVKKNSK